MERTLVIRAASHIFLGMSAKPLLHHTFLFAENAPNLRHDSINWYKYYHKNTTGLRVYFMSYSGPLGS